MSFEEVLREHGPALWRVIASYAPPGAERDDLAQDVLLAVWQALPRIRREDASRAFVLRVAHNRGLSHVFRRARRRTEPEPPELPDPTPGADEQLAGGERAERFLGHVRRLPLGQRQVLSLALEGLSRTEIAAIAGITPENVTMRLSRARATLRRCMQEEEEDAS